MAPQAGAGAGRELVLLRRATHRAVPVENILLSKNAAERSGKGISEARNQLKMDT